MGLIGLTGLIGLRVWALGLKVFGLCIQGLEGGNGFWV